MPCFPLSISEAICNLLLSTWFLERHLKRNQGRKRFQGQVTLRFESGSPLVPNGQKFGDGMWHPNPYVQTWGQYQLAWY